MIILYNENEKDFTSLGLGVLSDALTCTVKEKLNDTYSLSMTYPVTGQNYSKIQIGRIILAKPNPYDEPQPFRIYEISKAIKGRVTVSANHISYDMNYIPVKSIDAKSIAEVFVKISENSLMDNPFSFVSNVTASRTFQTSAPYNLRAILMGDEEESLIGVYKAEVKFDKYRCFLTPKRGRNRGAKVCYGYNMTDLSHTINTETLYNKVFPYYHKEEEEEETVNADEFKQAYTVGTTPFKHDWLSYDEAGSPFEPITNYPVQIASEGNYYQKVYSWNEGKQKYEEKIYNESVNLIQGVISPTWILIDWSKFPRVTCKANANGYYKKTGDTDWSELKSIGDIIFDSNLVSEGISGIATNMIMYFSEVIPNSTETVTKTYTNVTDVMLDNPIISVDTADARSMKYDRVLNLDLTSEFDEEPTKEQLKSKADQYIAEHKIGYVKHNTTVSFIDLAKTTEADKYSNFSHIEIGDTVKVVYQDLGVDVDLRVISTDYDVIKENYSTVELGEKEDNFASDSIQNGDKISSLSNNMGYADVTTVKKLIADTVTADFIQAKNAKLTKAQIENLEVGQFNISGSLQVSQLTLDTLVANMLIAENAQIAKTLSAGNIKVAGDISIKSGEITLGDDSGNTFFYVDREGNVTANSVEITGGSLTIGGEANNPTFSVDIDGNLYAQSATIVGTITATGGTIGGFTITENHLYYGTIGSNYSLYLWPNGQSSTATIASRTGNDWVLTAGSYFGVTRTGTLYCVGGNFNGKITGSSLEAGTNNCSVKLIKAYVKSGATAYSSTWLTNTNGGTDYTSSTISSSDADTTLIAVYSGGSLYSNYWYVWVSGTSQYMQVSFSYPARYINISATVYGSNWITDTSGSAISPSPRTIYWISQSNNPINDTYWLYSSTKLKYVYVPYPFPNAYTGSYPFEYEKPFSISTSGTIKSYSGNLNIWPYFVVDSYGKLICNKAVIGGWSVDTTHLYYGTLGSSGSIALYPAGTGNGTVAGTTQSTWSFAIGTSFGVTKAGVVYCSSINISGGTVAGPTVAGWNTDASKFYHGSIGSANSAYLIPGGTGSATIAGVAKTNWVFTCNANFGVDKNGYLYCSGAVLSGSITSTSGNIAGWSIDSNSFTYGTLGAADSMWLCNTGTSSSANIGGSGSITGWTIASGATFGVTKNGNLYCTAGKIGGFTLGATELYSYDTVNTRTIAYLRAQYSNTFASFAQNNSIYGYTAAFQKLALCQNGSGTGWSDILIDEWGLTRRTYSSSTQYYYGGICRSAFGNILQLRNNALGSSFTSQDDVECVAVYYGYKEVPSNSSTTVNLNTTADFTSILSVVCNAKTTSRNTYNVTCTWSGTSLTLFNGISSSITVNYIAIGKVKSILIAT